MPTPVVPAPSAPLPAVDVQRVSGRALGTGVACTVLHVRGEIDIHTAGPLQDAVRGEPTPATGALVVDLSGVTFCGAVGLRTLVELAARADRAGVPLELVVATPAVRRVLGVLGHDELLSTHPDLASACRALDLADAAPAPRSASEAGHTA